jgi:8-hydroxy-5-deazaflavin:NADPH oxidoreductase
MKGDSMKVGILGSGIVGQQLGTGFLRTGNSVKIGTRDGAKLNEWLSLAGANASVGSFNEAAVFGEIIILATNWMGTGSAVNLAGKEHFSGKIVIDVTNPLDFSKGAPPSLASVPNSSAGETIQSWLPDSKVVKAFNTISAYIMINPNLEEGNPDLVIAGNNIDAKNTVTDIAKSFGWLSVIDMGDISQAYLLEALAMLWISYGFKYNHWTHAFKLLKK